MRCHANIWLVPDGRENDRKIGDTGKGNRHSHDCLWHDQPQCWPTQTAFASAFWNFQHLGPGTFFSHHGNIGVFWVLFLDQWGGGYSGGEPTNVRETHKETSTNLTRNGLVFDQSWITKTGLTAGRPAISIGRCGCTTFFLTMVKSKWSRA